MPRKKQSGQRQQLTQRDAMQYIVDNPKRYSELVVARARQYLETGGSYAPRAETQSRTKERNSAQRSAARNRAQAGMSSQTTRQAVNRGTGLNRASTTDRQRLQTMADSYAAYGWTR